MIDYKKILWVSAGVSVISLALTWLYSKFIPAKGLATISLSVIDVPIGDKIKSGIDTSFVGQYLSNMFGSFPIGVQTVILLFITSFLVILIGNYLNKQLQWGKSENAKFAIDLTLGSLALGLIVGLLNGLQNPFSIGALGTALALFGYFIIVAGVYSLLRILGAKELLPTPQ